MPLKSTGMGRKLSQVFEEENSPFLRRNLFVWRLYKGPLLFRIIFVTELTKGPDHLRAKEAAGGD
jgi:hypothetical protein